MVYKDKRQPGRPWGIHPRPAFAIIRIVSYNEEKAVGCRERGAHRKPLPRLRG